MEADRAASSGDLSLLRQLRDNGEVCSYRGAGLAQEAGHAEVVAQLREWGVLSARDILLQVLGAEDGGPEQKSDGDGDGEGVWRAGAPLSQWTGVELRGNGSLASVALYSFVVRNRFKLRGRLPAEIGQLTDLQLLVLSGQAITGNARLLGLCVFLLFYFLGGLCFAEITRSCRRRRTERVQMRGCGLRVDQASCRSPSAT